jgi:23S rRNA (guanine745-N1)-methyltransferase
LIRSNPGLLACPVCGRELLADDAFALVCSNRHSFDISGAGYINLLTSAVKSDYGAGMLEARGRVCKAGFFGCLLSELQSIAQNFISPLKPGGAILLDAGCGEGSHLARIAGGLRGGDNGQITCMGVDISKDGVRIAAREHPGSLWCVADLARLPVAEGSTDVILNILSPANYAEFGRVLKEAGALIKAVPGAGYLKELRQLLYRDDRKNYSGERVVKLFSDSFPLLESRQVRQVVSVEGEYLRDLISMTPLSWRAAKENINAVLDKGTMDITVDFTILTGVNRLQGG